MPALRLTTPSNLTRQSARAVNLRSDARLAAKFSLLKGGHYSIIIAVGFTSEHMKRIKIISFPLTVSLLLAFSPPFEAQIKRARKYVVTFNSFGAVKIGMTVSKASKALGIRLTTVEQGECRYYEARRSFKEIGFMVNNGTIARFDVFERGIATDRGAQVGDTEARIKRLYKGMYKVSKHFYTDGHYISVFPKGSKYGIVFETDGKRVTHYQAGRSPEIGYVEGCS
jgi:hypothetical protein